MQPVSRAGAGGSLICTLSSERAGLKTKEEGRYKIKIKDRYRKIKP
jgi:hypothetical protein